MPSQQKALRMNVSAEGLRNAENDAARQCSPQAAGPADDGCFEAKNELHRSDVRIEA